MSRRKRRRRRGAATLLKGILIGAIVAAGLGAAGYFLLQYLHRPTFFLKERMLVIEAGTPFDPETLTVPAEDSLPEGITVDADDLDTYVPGIYHLKYARKDGDREEARPLIVRVEDTTAPVLSLKYDSLDAFVGESVTVAEAVAEFSDISPVKVTFQGGTDVYPFFEEGVFPIRVVAEDAYGNRTEAEFTATVIIPDTTAPVISGTDDVLLEVGEPFDVMAGVTAEDDRDPSPSLSCDAESVDTSSPGNVELHYEAVDADGNRSEAVRSVRIAEHVIRRDGQAYEVAWDPAGIDGQPFLAAVNRVTNTVTVYQMDESGIYSIPVRAFLCSTGSETPSGYFRTKERYRWRALFEDAFGQYAIRIEGHILFHSVPYYWDSPDSLEYEEFNLLGTPASLGCIRLCVADEKWLYDNCPEGFPCVIYDSQDPGPLGTPEQIWLDTSDEARRGWDPTDPDPNNPWNS